MRSTAIATFCAGLCLLTAGCRTNQNLLLLERENRDLEDALFQAEYDLEVCREANACACEDEYQGTGSRDEPSVGPTLRGEADDSPLDVEQFQQPSVELPSPSDQLPEKFRLPNQPGAPDLPEAPPYQPPPPALPKPSFSPPGNSPTGGTEMPGERSASQHDSPTLSLVDNNLVARVTIDSRETGGLDVDGNPGADGIVAALLPRSEDGRLLRAAAPVSVVVLDPALPDESARVARWDFSVDEVARAYSQSSPDQGVHLEMLWPDEPPVNNRLSLFVRYTTGDGRRYESENEIQVDLPGHPIQEWSPTSQTDRQPQVASRAATDWQRRQARIQSPAPVDPTPRPLPRVEKSLRTASRQTERTAAPTVGQAPAPAARQAPAWSPNR